MTPISPSAAHEVEVIVPSWNGAHLLPRVLESLEKQSHECAVCIVDNGSSDGTAALLEQRPDVRVLSLPQNAGFGAAINAGVATSDASLIVLINNDAFADPAFVESLVNAWHRSGAGMLAGCMRSPSGTIESLGVEVDGTLVTFDLGYGEEYPPDMPPDPLGPSGGAAAFERDVFLAAGGFDEAFFAYLEDTDLALRLRLSGVACEAVPEAFVWHLHSATLGSGSRAKNELMGFGRGYLLSKYRPALSRKAIIRGLIVDSVVYAGQAAIDRNLGAVAGRRRARRRLPAELIGEIPEEVADTSVVTALRKCLRRRRPSTSSLNT